MAPPKKYTLTQEDMEKIDLILRKTEQQDVVLSRITDLIQGNPGMTIEGIIPAQKRMQEQLNQLNDWKADVNLYFGIVTSGKMWRFVMYFSAAVGGIILTFKYGWHQVFEWVRKIF